MRWRTMPMIKRAAKMVLEVFNTNCKYCKQIPSWSMQITLQTQHFPSNSLADPFKSVPPPLFPLGSPLRGFPPLPPPPPLMSKRLFMKPEACLKLKLSCKAGSRKICSIQFTSAVNFQVHTKMRKHAIEQ